MQQATDGLILQALGLHTKRLSSVIYILRESLTAAQVRAGVNRLAERGQVTLNPDKVDVFIKAVIPW